MGRTDSLSQIYSTMLANDIVGVGRSILCTDIIIVLVLCQYTGNVCINVAVDCCPCTGNICIKVTLDLHPYIRQVNSVLMFNCAVF